MTQKEILLKVLAQKEWTPSYEIIKVSTPWGFLGTSADRVARTLVEQGKVKRRDDGKFTWFKLSDYVVAPPKPKLEFGNTSQIYGIKYKKF